ncbi:MAG: 50S ribosomal protein L10 [Candidatus Kerfeldbacteria bacterium]|nr:50S ribosomal protein L10 [Candidatus Kerfeldbacteria bacterium]
MSKTRQEKEAVLSDLTDKLKRMKAVVFTKYFGLTVKDVTRLRNQLRTEKIDFHVVKKTILRRALQAVDLDPGIVDALTGEVAVALSFEDEVMPAKLLQTFAKDHPAVVLLGAVVSGQLLSQTETKALAALPGRQALRAKLVWTLHAPLRGTVTVLSGPVRGLMTLLQALSSKQPASAG